MKRTKRQAFKEALKTALDLHEAGETVKMTSIKGCYIVVACGPRKV